MFEVDDEEIIVSGGESILIKKGTAEFDIQIRLMKNVNTGVFVYLHFR